MYSASEQENWLESHGDATPRLGAQMMRRISAKRIAAVEPGVRYRTPAVDKMLNCGVTPLSLLINATLIFIICFKLYIRA